MIRIPNLITLHNPIVFAGIFWNIALFVQCHDCKKLLLCPWASVEQLPEPDHCWKIAFNSNIIWASQTLESPRALDQDCTKDTAKPSSNCWYHFTRAELTLHVTYWQYLMMNLHTHEMFCSQKIVVPCTSVLS